MVDKEYFEKLIWKYGTSDPRFLSILSAFEEWGLSIPESLSKLLKNAGGKINST